MQALTKPKFFMPIHGEHKHLAANRELAKAMGMREDRIFVGEIGKVLELSATDARWNGVIPSGNTLIDGSGIGEIVSRGFVYVRESEELMDELRGIALDALNDSLRHKNVEWNQIKNNIKDDLAKFIYTKTKRRPMILPIIVNA